MSEAKLANVYDEEYKKVQAVGWEIQQQWNEIAPHIDIANTRETARKLNEFCKWAEDKMERIGFVALVDVSPIYADQPPSITLMDRIESEHFDHERKAHEVRKLND